MRFLLVLATPSRIDSRAAGVPALSVVPPNRRCHPIPSRGRKPAPPIDRAPHR